jgi:hypothetical protein
LPDHAKGMARWLLALGIVATLAANVAQGWSHGPVGAIVAAWPAASLVGSYELLLWLIRIAGEVVREPVAVQAEEQAYQLDGPQGTVFSEVDVGLPTRAGPGLAEPDRMAGTGRTDLVHPYQPSDQSNSMPCGQNPNGNSHGAGCAPSASR